MKCDDVKRLLSAYYDDELASTGEDVDRRAIETHLQNCEGCTRELQHFERLSFSAKQLPEAAAPQQWEAIEQSLFSEPSPVEKPAPRSTPRRLQSPLVYLPVSLAVIALIVLAGSWAMHLHTHDHGDHLAINFNSYLADFQERPEEAQQILMDSYQGQSVQMSEATRVLGYTPAASGAVKGYGVEAVYLLEMPCCQCPQVVLQRQGGVDSGSQIAVFEHEKDQPVWFGERPAHDAVCAGKLTRIVQVENGRLAATWENEDRHLTIIGARDEAEVATLIMAFKPVQRS